MGKVAPSPRTAAMWYEPVASIAALPCENRFCAGSTAVPVALGCRYGTSCLYWFSILMNQSSVHLSLPCSIWAHMSSTGALLATMQLNSWPPFPTSPPGQEIGTTPEDASFSHIPRNASQSLGARSAPALSNRSTLAMGMGNTTWYGSPSWLSPDFPADSRPSW